MAAEHRGSGADPARPGVADDSGASLSLVQLRAQLDSRCAGRSGDPFGRRLAVDGARDRIRTAGAPLTIAPQATQAQVGACVAAWMLHTALDSEAAPANTWRLVDAHVRDPEERRGPLGTWAFVYRHEPTGLAVALFNIAAPMGADSGCVGSQDSQVFAQAAGCIDVALQGTLGWIAAEGLDGLADARPGKRLYPERLLGLATSPLVVTGPVQLLAQLRVTAPPPDKRRRWTVLDVVGAVPVRDTPWVPVLD